MPSQTTTEELIARCAGRDATAFRQLYERTSAQLFAILLRILQRPDLAQEALQEVFVSVWRKSARFRPQQASGMTWLISIARHRAIDMRRRGAREFSIEDQPGGLAESWASPDASPPDAAAMAAEHQRLHDCMKELTPSQRNGIQLAYLNGYTHQEVARALDSPLGTVKSWIRRGLQALKECIDR